MSPCGAFVDSFECPRRTICAHDQGIVSGEDDLVWRSVIANGASQLRRPLSHRAQPPGPGQPDHQPGTSPFRNDRSCKTASATGRHAQLLLSCGLTFAIPVGAALATATHARRRSMIHAMNRRMLTM